MKNGAKACIISIAGSDSGGGAGIQADIKTIAALGGYGMTAITALTAQNGLGVTGVFPTPPEFVVEQLKALFAGFPVAAAKTGMLFSAGIIEAVADFLVEQKQKTGFEKLVVDPVSVSQSGHKLMQPEAIEALRQRIIPLAYLITPNKPEAEELAGMTITSVQDVQDVGNRLLTLGAQSVLLKGGHFDAPLEGWNDAFGVQSPDLLYDWLVLPDGVLHALPQSRIVTPNNHGTGCTLSAAIATFLGQGMSLKNAVEAGQMYLNFCLQQSYAPGEGAGPPNHLAFLLRKF